MSVLGYIIQYSDEDDYTVYSGHKKLYTVFTRAVEAATEIYRNYLIKNQDNTPFETYKPTKKECDTAGSVVIFNHPSFIVWIDCVVE